jgi:plasmid stabilization system protein ParE
VKPVAFHPDALIEMVEAARYYEGSQPALGGRYLDAVGAAVRRVMLQPSIYAIVVDDLRQCRVERFPFVVVFREAADAIHVIAVAHQRRRPRYWAERG